MKISPMLKNYLLALGLSIFLFSGSLAQSCFDLHQPGASTGAYTCISVDKNNRVWAGTDKQGLYSYNGEAWSKSAYLPTHNIVQIAPDADGGIWVGQSGTNFSAAGGGVNYISPDGGTEQKYSFSFVDNTRAGYGLPTPKIQSVAIDSIGRVWAAGSYSSLYVQGVGSYHNPGGVSIFTPGADRFTEIASSSMTYSSVGLIDGLRGKNVVSATGSGCIRSCITLAPAKGKMYLAWKGMGDCIYDSRIRAFNIPGGGAGWKAAVTYSFSSQNTPLPLSVTVSPEAMAVDRSGNIWVGLRQGYGFGVYQHFDDLSMKNKWHYLLDILPANTSVNRNAITASTKSGLVAIGTTFGLYIYKGVGDMMDMDSYYYFNTVNSNIPSDNITGVAFDKKDRVWIATDKGVASAVVGNAEMYTLKTHEGFYDTENFNWFDLSKESLRYQIKQFGRFSCLQEEEMAEVAADGSASTMFIWRGGNAANVEFRIKEDELANIEEYGYFEELAQDNKNDSVRFRYHHPEYLPTSYISPTEQILTVEVVDKTDQTVIFSEKVKVVLPPVLILHGILSDKGKTGKMADYLLQTGRYKKWMVKQGGFEKRDIGFRIEVMRDKLQQELDELLKECAENGLSAGKADVLAHSTAGLAVRGYIQNNYRKDINKFIAIHVPNSGSQYIDLLADERKVSIPVIGPASLVTEKVDVEIGKFIMFPTFFDEKVPEYGFFKDWVPFTKIPAKVLDLYLGRKLVTPPTNWNLYYEKQIRTNSDEIQALNSDASLQAEQEQGVPTHAVVDNFTHGFTGVEFDFLGKFTKYQAVGDKFEKVLDKGASHFIGPVLRYIVIKKGAGKLRGELEKLAAGQIIDKGVWDYFLEVAIFSDLNDGVVSASSQAGGLDTNAISYDIDFDVAHESSKDIDKMENSYDHADSQERIFNLLKEKSSSDKFSKSGFNPPKLTYDFCEGCPFVSESASNAKLAYITDGTDDVPKVSFEDGTLESFYYPGDSVKIPITKANYTNAVTLISLYGNDFEPLSTLIDDSTTLIKFKVPRNASGKLLLTTEVFDTLNAAIYIDTLTFTVKMNPDVTIDSIQIHTGRSNELYTFVDTTTTGMVTAFYSDSSVRVINIDPTFETTSILGHFSVDSTGGIRGLQEGHDLLIVSINGRTDSASVMVLPKLTEEEDPSVITAVTNENISPEKDINKSEDWFTAYPNPAENMINLRFKAANTSVLIKLIDASGKLGFMKSEDVKDGKLTIDVSTVHSGLYFVMVTELKTGNVKTKRILIQK